MQAITLLANEMKDIDTTQTTRKLSWEQPLEKEKIVNKIKAKKGCKCKKSMCLKLYCECFTAGKYCEGCDCVGCHNIADYNNERRKAITQIAKKNPIGLKRRAGLVKRTTKIANVEIGCNCTKSGCMKNYCECFKIGVECGLLCNCKGCKNKKLN